MEEIRLTSQQQKNLLRSILDGKFTKFNNPELWQDEYRAECNLNEAEQRQVKHIMSKIYGQEYSLIDPHEIVVSETVKPRLIRAVLKSHIIKSDFPELWPQPLPNWEENLNNDDASLLLKIARESTIIFHKNES